MRRLLFAVALLLIGLPLIAADLVKTTILMPKAIADGWLLLFDGESTYGWTIDGDSMVVDGVLKLGGGKPTLARFNTGFGGFDLRCEYRVEGKQDAIRWIKNGEGGSGVELQPTTEKGWYTLTTKAEYHPAMNQLQVSRETTAPSGKDLGKSALPIICKTNHNHLEFEVPAGTTLSLRHVRLQPLELKPLFNGKDLSGWKEHAGKKSKFAVVEGAINVKDGPGDLQSEGQWADFVLQLECISNGKHLNSGIFFRCRPGEYQQGYEAQVRNQFTPDAKQEYIVEEYDPKTNELKDKKKVKSTAVDYGTGAIYRRMPARKEMSKDGEWFTMTVVAHGRHIATWVNGIQVADWTDHRPLKDNARNGAMLDKGNISFQGHDPTTDLSFRNIRIAELPAVKK